MMHGAVRSFGTEDRETPYPIMPQPTVYDYILFRGSDIKDIRVVNNVAIPNDPAIMQMHLPPSQMPQQQNFTPQNFPPMQGQPGGAGPQMGQFGPFGGMQGGNMGMQQGGNMPPQPQSQSPVQQGNSNNNLAPGSGSGQKNKKSSECSKGNQESTDKSSTQPSRKQSNKSQGVHNSLTSLLLPFIMIFTALTLFCLHHHWLYRMLSSKPFPDEFKRHQRADPSKFYSRTIRTKASRCFIILFICFLSCFLILFWIVEEHLKNSEIFL